MRGRQGRASDRGRSSYRERMRLVLRIAAVLVALAAYYVVTTAVMWRFETAESGPERAFGDAVFMALNEQSKGSDSPVLTVCGFPPPGKEMYVLSHADVVHVARCLRRGRYMSASNLTEIEVSAMTIAGTQAGPRPVPGAPEGSVQRSGSWSYGGSGEIRERPWWVLVIWSAGAGVIIWLVGFRLPWRRRARAS